MRTRADKPSAKLAAVSVFDDATTDIYCPPTTNPWQGLSSRSHDNPWLDPPEVTAEMEALADAWDAAGLDLIREVEGLTVGMFDRWWGSLSGPDKWRHAYNGIGPTVHARDCKCTEYGLGYCRGI